MQLLFNSKQKSLDIVHPAAYICAILSINITLMFHCIFSNQFVQKKCLNNASIFSVAIEKKMSKLKTNFLVISQEVYEKKCLNWKQIFQNFINQEQIIGNFRVKVHVTSHILPQHRWAVALICPQLNQINSWFIAIKCHALVHALVTVKLSLTNQVNTVHLGRHR